MDKIIAVFGMIKSVSCQVKPHQKFLIMPAVCPELLVVTGYPGLFFPIECFILTGKDPYSG